MAIAKSRITAQGQVSVPAEVRRRLGAGPGTILEWHEQDGAVTVRKQGRFSWRDIHAALFPNGPPKARSIADMDAGIARYMKKKYGRR